MSSPPFHLPCPPPSLAPSTLPLILQSFPLYVPPTLPEFLSVLQASYLPDLGFRLNNEVATECRKVRRCGGEGVKKSNQGETWRSDTMFLLPFGARGEGVWEELGEAVRREVIKFHERRTGGGGVWRERRRPEFWVNVTNVGGVWGEDGKDEEDVKDDEDEEYESEDVPVQFPSSSSSLHSPLVTPSSYLSLIPTVPFSPPPTLSPSPPLSHHALHDHTPSTYSCVYYPSLPKDSDPKSLVLRPHVTDESACYVPLKGRLAVRFPRFFTSRYGSGYHDG